jgi:hypothetical protein
MPTPRQYQLDVDTKRYLNRVNTYRSLNGLADIQKSDAVDIDNFVIGLKDLGIWNYFVCWLLQSSQNIGTGTTVLTLGGFGSYPGTILGTALTWGLSGLNATDTSGTNRMQTDFTPDASTLTGAIGGVLRLDSNAQQTHRLITTDFPATNRGLGFDAFNPSSNTLRRLATQGSNFGSRPLTMASVAVGLGLVSGTSFTAFNSTFTTTTLVSITHPSREFRLGDAGSGICLGTYALCWWLNTGMNQTLYNSFVALLKQSICKNLNLP